MRYNNYQTNTYRRRSAPRASSPKNQPAQKPHFIKSLAQEFWAQLVICALVMGVVFGAQFLKLPNMNDSIAKMKTILTYSPSLGEIVAGAKEGTSALIDKISSGDKQVNDMDINSEEMPIIIVDDEIF